MFRLFRDVATVSRQTYQDGKSSYSPTGASYKWYLRVLSPEKQQTSIDKYGKEFSFVTKFGSDIQEADKLEINGVSYRVKGVGSHQGIRVTFTRALIVKE